MTGNERGSVLIEALVAVAILGGILALGFRNAGESALRTHRAELRRMAGLVAQSQLARVGADIPLARGTLQGVDGDFACTLTQLPAAVPPSRTGRLIVVAVDVRNRDGGASAARLQTLRLAPK